MDIKIIHEDKDILVINKPAGITVNKSETTVNQDTVQEWSENKLGIRSVKNESIENIHDFYKRGGIVHRLDKETSGLLIIAKTVSAFEDIQRQFKEREVKKVYIALVHGKIMPVEGEINVPVGRLPWNRERFGVLPGGRESVTKYKTISNFISTEGEVLTFLQLYPQSGRTHQIRVHLKYLHHPIFADYLYAGRKTARKDRKVLPRVFLHASKISFIHPASKDEKLFEALLPEELVKVLSGFSKV